MYDAVFLDRDGVLNVKAPDHGYITDPADLVLLPGAARAVRRLTDAGHPVFVVTNQRWVAGAADGHARLAAVHARLTHLLASQGAQLTGVFTCPHEASSCGCRKPLPGLVHSALSAHAGLRIDPGRCALVGDSEPDIEVGAHFGMTTVRIAPPDTPTTASHLASHLPAAVHLLETTGTE